MRFILKAVFYVLVMNAVMVVGAGIFGVDYEFNFIFNLVVPVICAYAAWSTEKRKRRMRYRYETR